jgi:cytochrome c biogenesis protein CcmG/thiol:disulfide interchange protein DsbE
MKKTVFLAAAMLAAAVLFQAAARPGIAGIEMRKLDGSVIKLSEQKGKVVILNFWATWCPPCKAEIPGFVSMHEKYGDKGLVIIGAAVDEPWKVERFIKDYGVNYHVVIADEKTAAAFGGISGLPTTFVIDTEGKTAKKYVGYRPDSVFLKDYEELKKNGGTSNGTKR